MDAPQRPRPRLLLHVLLPLLITALLPPAPTRAQPQNADLSSLFRPGYALQDRNEDAVIDFVNARIVLPDAPYQAEAISAANIAARLGFETAAANLDLATRTGDLGAQTQRPVILIGEAGRNLSDQALAEEDLPPGQGLIEVLPPSSQFASGGVRIVGGDATGLMAAANYFAGRLPALWALDGPTLSDATHRFQQFFAERELSVDSVSARYAVVDDHQPGVTALGLQVSTGDAATAARMQALLKGEIESENGRLDSLHIQEVHTIALRIVAPDTVSTVRLQPETPWETEAPEAKDTPLSNDFSLYDLYSTDGLFKDTNYDFIPDDVGGYISYAGSAAFEALVALTTRLGLETAGVRLPLVRPASQHDRPEQKGFPIFLGVDHPAAEHLRAAGKLIGAEPAPGDGYVQFVEEGAGENPALVVGGGDAEGLASVSRYMAERLPYLWTYGKGEYELRRIETDVRRFFQGVKGPGQVAAGLEKLQTWMERLEDKNLESVEVELAAEQTPEPLESFIRHMVNARFPSTRVSAQTYPTGFGVGKTVVDEQFEIPWEVDAFWDIFRSGVLPEVTADAQGRITLRVSESPEIRAQLKEEIEAELAAKGAERGAVDVSVLSAYKQGFSWLVDEVLPNLKKRDDVGRVEITYHTLKESDEVRWQHINANTRWLQELYPVDAVLARELGIADSLITFRPTWEKHPIYTVAAFNQDGEHIYTDSFDPKYVVRPYFDRFPEHDSVRVTTGWLRAELNGATVADRRIKTDLETFWDHFQTKTVGQIIDYVMDIQNGQPRPENAPFFDELRANVRLSEPNYRLGVQEHTISSTEALHEDIYFHMLALFNLIGNRYNVEGLNYPGRILPFIEPPVDGQPGQAHIQLTGKERARPELKLTYREEGKERVVKRYPLPNIENVPTPKLRGLWTRAGHDGLSRLRFDVEAEVERDAYEDYRQRAPEEEIDRAYPSVERLNGMLDMLNQLQAEGMFEEVLSYDRVDELNVHFTLADSSAFSQVATLPRTPHPTSTDLPELHAEHVEPNGSPIVQWETPIPPGEANELMAKLGTFPVVNPYYMTTSLLGHEIFAMDLVPPHEAKYVSQAKLNAQKPTLFLNAREDGNEVSSTSYTLRLAEKIATDPAYTQYLDSVNVVIHPMNNPDGAQVAYEMQKTNPDFMLHAGYYAALGPSMEEQERRADPLYPEAKVEPRLRKTWLPDLFMNLHGYPSHEWVQYFSGYSAWVFSRNGKRRSWWPTRGYFLTGFDWVDDPDHPELKTVAFAALDSITTALSTLDELTTKSPQAYRRYRKYRSHEDDFGEYFRNGIRVHSSLKGEELEGDHPTDYRDPRITNFSIVTEAQDETARGDWLRLQARAGRRATTAALRYLYYGENRVQRDATEEGEYIVRKVHRKKPVLPDK